MNIFRITLIFLTFFCFTLPLSAQDNEDICEKLLSYNERVKYNYDYDSIKTQGMNLYIEYRKSSYLLKETNEYIDCPAYSSIKIFDESRYALQEYTELLAEENFNKNDFEELFTDFQEAYAEVDSIYPYLFLDIAISYMQRWAEMLGKSETMFYLAEDIYMECDKLLKNYLNVDPYRDNIRLIENEERFANLLFFSERYEQAAPHYRKATNYYKQIQKGREDIPQEIIISTIREGRSYYQAKRYDVAIRVFGSIFDWEENIKKHKELQSYYLSDRAITHYWIGKSYYMKGDYKNAEKNYKIAEKEFKVDLKYGDQMILAPFGDFYLSKAKLCYSKEKNKKAFKALAQAKQCYDSALSNINLDNYAECIDMIGEEFRNSEDWEGYFKLKESYLISIKKIMDLSFNISTNPNHYMERVLQLTEDYVSRRQHKKALQCLISSRNIIKDWQDSNFTEINIDLYKDILKNMIREKNYLGEDEQLEIQELNEIEKRR